MDLNKKRTGIEEKFFNICLNLVKENGLELYDLDYVVGSSTLRVFIMHPETQTAVIEDCIRIDQAMTPYFEEQWVPDDIVLEVSSPGVYRALKTLEHFKMSQGEMIILNLEKPMGELVLKEMDKELSKGIKKSKKIRGKLIEVNDNNIKVNIDQNNVVLTFEQIKKAALDPDL